MYACVAPLIFLPILYVVVLFIFFFEGLNAHCVCCYWREFRRRKQCVFLPSGHEQEDTLHAMQVVVYYFYLPLKKKIERNKCGSLMALRVATSM